MKGVVVYVIGTQSCFPIHTFILNLKFLLFPSLVSNRKLTMHTSLNSVNTLERTRFVALDRTMLIFHPISNFTWQLPNKMSLCSRNCPWIWSSSAHLNLNNLFYSIISNISLRTIISSSMNSLLFPTPWRGVRVGKNKESDPSYCHIITCAIM